LGEARAKAVRARDVGACLGAENDACAFAIERALCVAGVIERASRDLEREKLNRVDGGERARRDSVGARIEERGRDESAPFRRRLFARAFGIVIKVGVPAIG
jgi:hypothetical protein